MKHKIIGVVICLVIYSTATYLVASECYTRGYESGTDHERKVLHEARMKVTAEKFRLDQVSRNFDSMYLKLRNEQAIVEEDKKLIRECIHLLNEVSLQHIYPNWK